MAWKLRNQPGMSRPEESAVKKEEDVFSGTNSISKQILEMCLGACSTCPKIQISDEPENP